MLRRLAAFIDRWHWVFLILATPFLLFPSRATAPVLLVVPLLWLVACVVRPAAPLPSTPLNSALLLMLIMVLVSVLVTPDLTFSLPKVAGMVLAFGVFFAMAREARGPLGLWLCLLMLLTSGLGIATVGLLGTQWGAKVSFIAAISARLGTRLTGLAGAEEGLNPNQVAGALLWVSPVFAGLSAGLIVATRRGQMPRTLPARLWRYRGVAIAALVIAGSMVLGVLVLAQSRGAYVALAVTLAGIALVLLPARGRWLFTGALLAGILVAVLIVWRVGPGVVAQRLGLSADARNDPSNVIDTIDGRLEIWSRAVYGIEDFPLTGMGMNSFRRVVHLLYPLFLISPDTDFAHAHNEFLQAALDLGIPGLIAFGAIYVIAAWMLHGIWVASGAEPLSRALVLGLGGGLLAHLVYGLTDAVALGAKPGVLFWMLLGLTCGLFSQYRDRPPDQLKALCNSLVAADAEPLPLPIPSQVMRHD